MMPSLLAQVPAPPAPPQVPDVFVSAPEVLPPWMVLPAPVVALGVLAICAASVMILWPLMRAIGRRIEGRAHDPALQQEVLDLRERVAELEASQGRLAELEERLDFAERLLAQRREAEPLPPG